MPNVVFCVNSFEVGGTELNTVRTAERLDRTRFDLQVVCLSERGPLRERYDAARIPVHPFPIHTLVGPSTIAQGWRLARFLREREVSVLHAFGLFENIFAVPWARMSGVPTVLASRRWWANPASRVHASMNRAAYRFAHAVVANSPAVAEMVMSEDGIRPERVRVISNFLEEEAFSAPPTRWEADARAEFGLAADDVVIGMIARLHPVKDHATLLRAFQAVHRHVPQALLFVVGDGAERKALEALAEELGISGRVRFAGARPSRPSFHHLFDISVLSSRSEGFPNSLLEAMAAGKPVVATRVGGSVDAVIEGETGLLVPPGDPSAMEGALTRLAGSALLRETMGGAGSALARARFGAAASLNALEALYGHPGERPEPVAPNAGHSSPSSSLTGGR